MAELDPYSPLLSLLRTSEHPKISLNVDLITQDKNEQSELEDKDRDPFQNKRILAVVSNIEGTHEEACVVLLKRRRQDPEKASALCAVPLLKDTRISVEQLPSPISITASPTSSKSTKSFKLTISSGGDAIEVSLSDSQGIQDLLTVIKELVQVAKENQSKEAGSTHQWLHAYLDDKQLPSGANAPIFSRFTKSSFLPNSTPHQRSISPPPNSLKITIHSYNAGGALPRPCDHSALAAWIRSEEESDLLVFGFQEMDLTSTAYLYWTPHREDTWTECIESGLGKRRNEYQKLASKQLVGVFIMIFVKKNLAPFIPKRTVEVASLGYGLGGVVANKGACGIRFRIVSPNPNKTGSDEKERGKGKESSQTICFVTCHLSAFDGSEAVERRNWDWSQILTRLKFDLDFKEAKIGKGLEKALLEKSRLEIRLRKEWENQFGKSNGDEDDESLRELDIHREPEKVELGVEEHDFIFIFGDLNYRLDLSNHEVKRLIRKRQFDLLLKYDQLKLQNVHGFVEGKINFSPTYKFDRDTCDYDTSEKQRTPAWTDRILFKAPNNQASIQQISYESIPSAGLSDHKPIVASFIIKLS